MSQAATTLRTKRIVPTLLISLTAALVAAVGWPVINIARAQSTGATATTGTTVSGTVRDSLSHQPLARAIVQLVSASDPARFTRTENADSLGRFTFSTVPDGEYKLGFFHPLLDSLGIEVPLRNVFVDKLRPVRTDLGVPAASTLRKAMCGRQMANRTSTDSGGVVVGFVRDARTMNAAANATVSAQWAELTLSVRGIERRLPRTVVKTTAEGWFVVCDVPGSGPIEFLAAAAGDSTDRIELEMPKELFLRRDFYVGPSRPVVRSATGDTAPRARTTSSTANATAGQRLTGVVVTSLGAQPIAGAEVKLVDGAQVRANERGEWTMPNVPVGTRMMEIRAVGYYPERRVVDVVDGAAAIRSELATLKSVLDTVKVRAARNADRHESGFAARQRQGYGKFVTAADIDRRRPVNISDMLKMQPSVRLERSSDGSSNSDILIRAPLGDGLCKAEFYIDGVFIGPLQAEELDSYFTPRAVLGMEIYAGATIPGQFNRGLSGLACGVIVVWSK